jgi:hypothetical protein
MLASGARLVAGHRRIVVSAQLVIGQAALMQRGALLVELRLCPLAGRFLLGDPRALLCRLGALRTRLRRVAVLAHGPLTALLELALLGPSAGAPAHARQEQAHEQHEQDRDHHDGDDDPN